ncbi:MULTISPECIES: hypothetical protein [unclassified Streptomyces]|uniref:hypothetical protein n=1 Tax=unclassified Streptomyces TaxID=2593676 RepID=UPI00278C27CA|nr:MULTISPECIES: hypothetical protein [unclassified Streptomyces]
MAADAPVQWPVRVTARIVTAYALRFDDLRASVDVIDEFTVDGGHKSRAVCGPCNRQVAELPQAFRDDALDAAAEHAKTCMAMPQPTGEGGGDAEVQDQV